MVDQRKRVVQKSEVAVQFTGKNLTSVGGIGLFHKFARQLGVEKALASRVELPRRVGKYTSARLLLSLVYAFVLDLTRLSDTLLLRQDKVSHKLVGFGDFPHPSTLSRFLARFTVPKAKEIGKATVDLLLQEPGSDLHFWCSLVSVTRFTMTPINRAEAHSGDTTPIS